MSDPAQARKPSKWLLSRDGKTFGPMTSSELRKACEVGKILRSDLVCRDGSDRWVSAESVRGLFPETRDTSNDRSGSPPLVAIRPMEDAAPSKSNDADAFWKTAGAIFCFTTLAACGLFGLLKEPPESVQLRQRWEKTAEETVKNLSDTTKEADSMFKNILSSVRDIEKKTLRDDSPGSRKP